MVVTVQDVVCRSRIVSHQMTRLYFQDPSKLEIDCPLDKYLLRNEEVGQKGSFLDENELERCEVIARITMVGITRL